MAKATPLLRAFNLYSNMVSQQHVPPAIAFIRSGLHGRLDAVTNTGSSQVTFDMDGGTACLQRDGDTHALFLVSDFGTPFQQATPVANFTIGKGLQVLPSFSDGHQLVRKAMEAAPRAN